MLEIGHYYKEMEFTIYSFLFCLIIFTKFIWHVWQLERVWETATNDRETRGYLKLIDDIGLINSCYANMTETELWKRSEVLVNI